MGPSTAPDTVRDGKGMKTQKIEHIAPTLVVEDLDYADTSRVEPKGEELNESDWVEVNEADYSKESLADYGRPGRRTMANGK
ncbi:hypothetical protein J1614_003911 [Plenodomus biglobosus]|nr:hypothetical protein J1614_003911 [Plenodomus biglobosus]